MDGGVNAREKNFASFARWTGAFVSSFHWLNRGRIG
jgi:hypothetical protein